MRVAVVLLALLGCKDKTTAEAPRPGAASAALDAAAVSRPPNKSTPLDAARAAELAKLDFEGWTKTVRLADAKGLEVRYARPPQAVTVHASKCFDCLPMEDARWRAKADALRTLIPPELRDHRDTSWELGMTDLAGTPFAWTLHVGFSPEAYGTAYTLHFNDGVTMIRVVAEYAGDAPNSREAMTAAAPKDALAVTAKAFADRFVHAW